MVLDIDGVVKVAPVPIGDPPDAFAYQFIVPVHPVVERVTVPVPQRLAPVPVMLLETTLTVTVDVAAQAAGDPASETETV